MESTLISYIEQSLRERALLSKWKSNKTFHKVRLSYLFLELFVDQKFKKKKLSSPAAAVVQAKSSLDSAFFKALQTFNKSPAIITTDSGFIPAALGSV